MHFAWKDRLSRLEATVTKEKDAYEEEYSKKISKLESELEHSKSELAAEHKKAGELAAENAKLKYRMTHLVQAVKEADLKLEGKGAWVNICAILLIRKWIGDIQKQN